VTDFSRYLQAHRELLICIFGHLTPAQCRQEAEYIEEEIKLMDAAATGPERRKAVPGDQRSGERYPDRGQRTPPRSVPPRERPATAPAAAEMNGADRVRRWVGHHRSKGDQHWREDVRLGWYAGKSGRDELIITTGDIADLLDERDQLGDQLGQAMLAKDRLARQVDHLRAQRDVVLDLHQTVEISGERFCKECSFHWHSSSDEEQGAWNRSWPCPTARVFGVE